MDTGNPTDWRYEFGRAILRCNLNCIRNCFMGSGVVDYTDTIASIAEAFLGWMI